MIDPNINNVIEIEGLNTWYGNRQILSNVSLSVVRKEIMVIMGRSGSGKSTLLNLISGIDAPDNGDIVVNGVAINQLTERQRTLFRREHVGFIFQFFNLIPTLTVFENVTLAMQLNGGVRKRGDEPSPPICAWHFRSAPPQVSKGGFRSIAARNPSAEGLARR